MTTTVVLAEDKESIDQAMEIRRKVFIEEQSVPPEMEIDEHESSSVHFLARVDGLAVGAGRIRLKQSYVKFERIATLREFRGKGIGRVLTQKMLEVAEQRYPTHLPAMHAQESAIGFYLKLGWLAVGEKFMEANIVHQVLIYLPSERTSLQGLRARHDPQCRRDIREEIERRLQGC